VAGGMSAAFEAILFDFDGVLVDTEPLHYECWLETISRHGLTLPWEEYVAKCIGISDKTMIQALCDANGRPDLFDVIWAEYPSKKALFRERAVAKVPMLEATRGLLRSLTGYKLAVVSSSGRTEVEPILAAAGVLDCFDTLVTGREAGELKPSPDPYLAAAARLGVTRALVVEDSEAGIASGRAAGFEVLAIPSAEAMPRLLQQRLKSAASC
jgi:HAD superfamily hydrolase (TIGR01509 family)